MIVFSGLGFLVLLFGVGFAALAQFGTQKAFNDDKYFDTHGWPILVALWAAALAVFLVARRVDAKPGQAVVDKATGQEMVLRKQHHLFFVPLRYWTYLLLAGGVALYFVKANGAS